MPHGNVHNGLERPQLSTSLSLGAANAVLWTIWRHHLSGAVAWVVPEHTREAAFQLACDWRANTPKDRRFLQRHARALAPHTLPGWLALASALGFGFSGLVALSCAAVALSVAGLWGLMGLTVAAGLFLSGVLSVLAVSLCVAAVVGGAMAWGALLMYTTAATTLACLRLAGRLVLGPPRALAPAPPPPPEPHHDQARAAHSSAEQQLALPAIRTKSPVKGQLAAAAAANAAGGAPPVSPRKLNPAAAAASALSDAHTPAPAVAPAVLESAAHAQHHALPHHHHVLLDGAAHGQRPSPFSSGPHHQAPAGKPEAAHYNASGVSNGGSPPPSVKTPPALNASGNGLDEAVSVASDN